MRKWKWEWGKKRSRGEESQSFKAEGAFEEQRRGRSQQALAALTVATVWLALQWAQISTINLPPLLSMCITQLCVWTKTLFTWRTHAHTHTWTHTHLWVCAKEVSGWGSGWLKKREVALGEVRAVSHWRLMNRSSILLMSRLRVFHVLFCFAPFHFPLPPEHIRSNCPPPLIAALTAPQTRCCSWETTTQCSTAA